MAAFYYEGNPYFNVNGKWLDPVSKPVPQELSDKLDVYYNQEEKNKREAVQRDNAERRTIQKKAPNEKTYEHTDIMSLLKAAKTIKNDYRKATEITYTVPVELTKEQKEALSILESGENVFLSGEAGTGKSFVLNEFIRKSKNKNIIVCAPTGIAALNVGGSTLHRVFNIPVRALGPEEYNTKPSESLIKADIIVIDEISMCRFDIFEYVIKTIKRAEEIRQENENRKALQNGEGFRVLDPKQLIVVGDFYQLPPVIVTRDKEYLEKYWEFDGLSEGFAFQTRSWKTLNFRNAFLKEVVRQKDDIAYTKHLNMIRRGIPSAIGWFNENAAKTPMKDSIYLCGTNKTANKINDEKSAALSGAVYTYTAKTEGDVKENDKMTLDQLELKEGMQVMTLVNNIEEGYQNGSIGKIVSLKADSVGVQLNTGRYVEVRPYEWEIIGYEVQEDKLQRIVLGYFRQMPLKVAYAITIHKSQGQTYEKANILPDCFTVGQLYVALSRVQSINGLYLEHPISRFALRKSISVEKFYETIENQN